MLKILSGVISNFNWPWLKFIFSEVSEIERLVEKLGVEVLSARDQHGYTPAHWAALDGSVAVMRYLVERGAPIDLSCLGTQVMCYTFINL